MTMLLSFLRFFYNIIELSLYLFIQKHFLLKLLSFLCFIILFLLLHSSWGLFRSFWRLLSSHRRKKIRANGILKCLISKNNSMLISFNPRPFRHIVNITWFQLFNHFLSYTFWIQIFNTSMKKCKNWAKFLY